MVAKGHVIAEVDRSQGVRHGKRGNAHDAAQGRGAERQAVYRRGGVASKGSQRERSARVGFGLLQAVAVTPPWRWPPFETLS